ncbi:MAG: carbohydrate ABC transporter permease [Candidatus Humimicrobiaceae bacterium]
MKSGLNKITKIVIFVGMFLMAMISIYFLFFMFINSFKTQTEYLFSPLALPKEMYLSNYVEMFKSYDIVKLFANSLIIVSSSVFIEILLSSLAAYAFAKTKFKGKNLIFVFFISLMIIPFQVLMLPLYIMFAKINLINTRISLIIIYSAVLIPFALYFLTINFRRIPNSIMESARIDGASYFRIYWSIILPLGKPALMTLFILDFIFIWNEIVLGLIFLQSDKIKTMTVAVATILGERFFQNEPLLLTGLLLSCLPTIILYSFVARFIMKGAAAGAVKG